MKTRTLKLFASAMLCALCQPVSAKLSVCTAAAGDPNGNYLIPDALGDFPRSSLRMAEDGRRETGSPMYLRSSNRWPAGFAWFSIEYRLTPYVHNAYEVTPRRSTWNAGALLFLAPAARLVTLGEERQ